MNIFKYLSALLFIISTQAVEIQPDEVFQFQSGFLVGSGFFHEVPKANECFSAFVNLINALKEADDIFEIINAISHISSETKDCTEMAADSKTWIQKINGAFAKENINQTITHMIEQRDEINQRLSNGKQSLANQDYFWAGMSYGYVFNIITNVYDLQQETNPKTIRQVRTYQEINQDQINLVSYNFRYTKTLPLLTETQVSDNIQNSKDFFDAFAKSSGFFDHVKDMESCENAFITLFENMKEIEDVSSLCQKAASFFRDTEKCINVLGESQEWFDEIKSQFDTEHINQTMLNIIANSQQLMDEFNDGQKLFKEGNMTESGQKYGNFLKKLVNMQK